MRRKFNSIYNYIRKYIEVLWGQGDCYSFRLFIHCFFACIAIKLLGLLVSKVDFLFWTTSWIFILMIHALGALLAKKFFNISNKDSALIAFAAFLYFSLITYYLGPHLA